MYLSLLAYRFIELCIFLFVLFPLVGLTIENHRICRVCVFYFGGF